MWEKPSTPDMWSFMYRVEWQNGTTAVEDTADTRVSLSGLEAATQYTVTITAFTDSTLCAEQSVNLTFNTTQSKWWLVSTLLQISGYAYHNVSMTAQHKYLPKQILSFFHMPHDMPYM